MKATDLMIGDWVRINYRNKLAQVTEIVEKAIGTTAISPLSEDEFEPIPLTPEILVKNGFLKTDDWFRLADDFYDIDIIEISDSIWRVRYNNLECSAITDTFHICFIHELQHALKLCRIDKEIKL